LILHTTTHGFWPYGPAYLSLQMKGYTPAVPHRLPPACLPACLQVRVHHHLPATCRLQVPCPPPAWAEGTHCLSLGSLRYGTTPAIQQGEVPTTGSPTFTFLPKCPVPLNSPCPTQHTREDWATPHHRKVHVPPPEGPDGPPPTGTSSRPQFTYLPFLPEDLWTYLDIQLAPGQTRPQRNQACVAQTYRQVPEQAGVDASQAERKLPTYSTVTIYRFGPRLPPARVRPTGD